MHDTATPGEADLEIRRKRLRFRCRHRGTKELDLLLGRFVDGHLAAMSGDQITRFEALLDCQDHDLYAWITGKAPPPAPHDHDVMTLMQNFISTA